jgi:DNA modification methylase
MGALELLKQIGDNSIDLVLTDPPYIISRKTGFKACGPGGVERLRISMNFGKWDNLPMMEHTKLMKAVINEYYRVLKKSGTCIIWYDLFKIGILKDWMEAAGLKQVRFIEWIKTNPVPINSKINYLTNGREAALSSVKSGKPVFNSVYDNGVYSAPIHRDGGKRLHPTQKPLGITRDLILKHSLEGGLVLDTFCGSGTTLIAALETGRNFLGCEIDEDYYDSGVKRIEKEQLSLKKAGKMI